MGTEIISVPICGYSICTFLCEKKLNGNFLPTIRHRFIDGFYDANIP